jgi:hypothetical protein
MRRESLMASKRYNKHLKEFETKFHDLVWTATFEDGLDLEDVHVQVAHVLCAVTMHAGIEVGETTGRDDAIEKMKAKSAAAGGK